MRWASEPRGGLGFSVPCVFPDMFPHQQFGALRIPVELAGAGRLMLGSDYLLNMGDDDSVGMPAAASTAV